MATKNQHLSQFAEHELTNCADLKVGIVVSEWNSDITENLYIGARNTLIQKGVLEKNIYITKVPGAFELPLACKTVFKNIDIDGIIAIGVVIQGETKHFDYVCSGTTNGIMQVQLEFNKPISFCVLTDNNKQQSIDRSGGKHGNKGIECAIACLKMILLQKKY